MSRNGLKLRTRLQRPAAAKPLLLRVFLFIFILFLFFFRYAPFVDQYRLLVEETYEYEEVW